jgi:hypothetical protein
MAVAKTRVIYTEGLVSITGVGAATIQTAQNATFTLTVPRENVNSMGYEGVVDRPQLDATDATLEFAFIPQTANSGGKASDMNAIAMDALIDDAILGTPQRSALSALGVGALTGALMNSIAVDGAVGAMPTTTLGFTGVDGGIPAKGTPTSANSLTVELVEPKNIALTGLATSCAQSAAVAWDLPVEVVICLSDDPNTDGEAFGNPPGTASITVETLEDELAANTQQADYTVVIGDFDYELQNARVDSKTNSMAVGDLFATFNYVLGGTADGFEVT